MVDVTTSSLMDVGGGQSAGDVSIAAGRDVFIKGNLRNNGGGMLWAEGGSISITAARNLVISPDSGPLMIRSNGGAGVERIGYYSSRYGGYGGVNRFSAGAALTIGDRVTIETHAGKGGVEGYTTGGSVYLESQDTVAIYGDLSSFGASCCGNGGYISVVGQGGVTVGSGGRLDVTTRRGGTVVIDSDGPVEFDGKIDVRGRPGSYNYYAYNCCDPYGGYAYLRGRADLSLGGRILGGCDDCATDIDIDVCRLTLESGGVVDQTFKGGYGSIYVSVGESMEAKPGSSLLTDPEHANPGLRIRYRDSAKPPVLLGKVEPPATLVLDPTLTGCPVCGNLEIDQGESCDDGNLSSGDGCRDDCQDEGCLLQSPGFPAIALCDDGDACTLDSCDPVNHACINLASCEEGVSCTVDVCVAGACEHTPSDALCDDGDDCTDDLCNLSTGCVYADLSGNACEDGDRCTLTGSCNAGVCEASDQRLSSSNKLAARFRDGPGNDRLNFKGSLPLADFNSLPTATGLSIEVLDASGAVVFSSSIPAADFEDLGGDGLRFRFRDNRFEVPSANGVVNVSLKLIAAKGIAKLKIKVKERELSGLEGQGTASVSLLWGADPALDDCLTAWRMPCTAKATRTFCKQ
ncbi:MAG: hypothetical protein ACE5E4_05860 [Candidatus Binatia bacterium]